MLSVAEPLELYGPYHFIVLKLLSLGKKYVLYGVSHYLLRWDQYELTQMGEK